VSTCHAEPPDDRSDVAPCGATIRATNGAERGDRWSSSLRFIDCPACRELVKAGRQGQAPLALEPVPAFSRIVRPTRRRPIPRSAP
jgi:hypothetical protein